MSPSSDVVRKLIPVLLIAFCAESALGHGPRCQLIVTTAKKSFSRTERIGATIRVTNPGEQPVAVAKPLLPRRWSVRFRGIGRNEKRDWFGGVVQGGTDSGSPPRYADTEYEIIPPGGEFTREIDLAWILRDQEPQPPPGQYEVIFHYDHLPNDAERDIPLVAYAMTAKALKVEVVSD